jgi:phytoene desaturase
VILATTSSSPPRSVVSGADLVHTYGELIHPRWRRKYTDARLARYEPSSSAFILYLGVRGTYPGLDHHNVFFPADYAGEMRRIFGDKRPPRDPTVYVGDFARADPRCAPWRLGALRPRAGAAHHPGVRLGARGRRLPRSRHRQGQGARAAGYRGAHRRGGALDALDFATRHNNNHGSIFGLSGKWSQSTFFHPPNRSEEIRGLYFAGGSAQPGGGIPLVLLSGEITAGLVLEDLSE